MRSPKVTGKVVKIEAHSRRSDKIHDTIWTFEAVEVREIDPDRDDVDMEKEWADLWNSVNTEIDKQVSDAASC